MGIWQRDRQEAGQAGGPGESGEHKPAVDALIGRLSHPDPDERLEAAESLWVWGLDLDPTDQVRCVAALKPVATTDLEASVRAEAVVALLEFEAPCAVDLALAALHDPDPAIRGSIATALGDVEDARVVGALLPLLEDRDGGVRRFAAETLGERGDPAALEALRAMVRREGRLWRGDARTLRAAQRAIAQIETPGVSPEEAGWS